MQISSGTLKKVLDSPLIKEKFIIVFLKILFFFFDDNSVNGNHIRLHHHRDDWELWRWRKYKAVWSLDITDSFTWFKSHVRGDFVGIFWLFTFTMRLVTLFKASSHDIKFVFNSVIYKSTKYCIRLTQIKMCFYFV